MLSCTVVYTLGTNCLLQVCPQLLFRSNFLFLVLRQHRPTSSSGTITSTPNSKQNVFHLVLAIFDLSTFRIVGFDSTRNLCSDRTRCSLWILELRRWYTLSTLTLLPTFVRRKKHTIEQSLVGIREKSLYQRRSSKVHQLQRVRSE